MNVFVPQRHVLKCVGVKSHHKCSVVSSLEKESIGVCIQFDIFIKRDKAREMQEA